MAALIFITPLSRGEQPNTEEEAQQKVAKQSLAVYENYLRLKNGVAPAAELQPKKDALLAYRLAFANARDANTAIAGQAEPNCQRFVRLYDDVGAQIIFYYERYLDPDRKYPENVRKLIEARLRILDFYEKALFSLVFLNAEAGSSVLDPGARKTCTTSDRKVWTTLLLSTHDKLQSLHDKVLGEPGALLDESEAWKQLASEYGWKRSGIQWGWLGIEALGSIYLWDRTAGKVINYASLVTGARWKLRAIKFLTNTAYISGWVAFDRYMRTKLPFLVEPPEFRGQDPMAGWNDMMQMGEDFLVSNLASPPLYFAYIQLLSITRKRTIYEFLRDHEWSLQQAEQEYGSIENAIENLKEVTHEKPDVTKERRSNGDIHLLSDEHRRAS